MPAQAIEAWFAMVSGLPRLREITRQDGRLTSAVHDGQVGRDADRGCDANGRRGAREGEDRARHEGAGGADRQHGWGEDGTPNSHDDLHASTEADSLRAGPGGHARHGGPCRSSPVFG